MNCYTCRDLGYYTKERHHGNTPDRLIRCTCTEGKFVSETTLMIIARQRGYSY